MKGAELVKLDIPFSKLTKSKDLAGAARGYVNGGRGVAAQANLTKVDMTKISKATTVANGVANVMNVGSLVVGQYYMTEINAKLEKMNDNINKISDFQDREFKSRIMSLIARTEKYSAFSTEIIENDELRLRTLGTLESLEGDTTEQWHDAQVEALKIDLDKNRKSKTWFAALPGIVNENWKYQSLSQGLAEKINNQSQTRPLSSGEPKAVFEEDVEIIIRDGKYFYLHDNEQSSSFAVADI